MSGLEAYKAMIESPVFKEPTKHIAELADLMVGKPGSANLLDVSEGPDKIGGLGNEAARHMLGSIYSAVYYEIALRPEVDQEGLAHLKRLHALVTITQEHPELKEQVRAHIQAKAVGASLGGGASNAESLKPNPTEQRFRDPIKQHGSNSRA